MTLTEAIENLKYLTRFYSGDLLKSLKLAIEAVREVEKARFGDPALDGELLKGEIKE